MLAPEARHLLGHIAAIGRHFRRHMVCIVHEHAAHAVPRLLLPQRAHHLRQQRAVGPGRPPEHRRRVGAGRHRREVAQPLGRVHRLRLVALQQQARRGPDDVGCRRGGQEQATRAAHLQDIALAGASPLPTRPAFQQAQLAIERLRPIRGAGLDDLPASAAVDLEQVRLDERAEFVLARLPAHQHGEAQPLPLDNRRRNRPRGLALVGPQVNTRAIPRELFYIPQQYAPHTSQPNSSRNSSSARSTARE